MWTLNDALYLIRTIQPRLHEQKYHMALGGGVLNAGQSVKDLDLYVFTFDDTAIPPILPYFESLWGEAKPISDPRYPSGVNFDTKVKFSLLSGQRIDLFITRNGVA